MKEPIIHDGKPFDWKAGAEAMQHAVTPEGEPNWGALMAADPGVMKCPGCGVHLWQEGRIVECPECGEAWNQAKRMRERDAALNRIVDERKKHVAYGPAPESKEKP